MLCFIICVCAYVLSEMSGESNGRNHFSQNPSNFIKEEGVLIHPMHEPISHYKRNIVSPLLSGYCQAMPIGNPGFDNFHVVRWVV